MRPCEPVPQALCAILFERTGFSSFLFFFPFSPLKRAFIPHLFLPHPPSTRHAIGMKGVTRVEQDGFTSANVGDKMAQMSLFCMQHRGTRRGAAQPTPRRGHVIGADRVAYVTLGVAMAQMQLVTQPIAHSYRCTELRLYNYVRLHYSSGADRTAQRTLTHRTWL